MGHHYIPQKYLEGFSVQNEGQLIFQYDKQAKPWNSKPLPIKNVAQSPDFYDATIEQYLNRYVEKPANNVLKNIRNSPPSLSYELSAEDRYSLSFYIAVMWTRVPKCREDLTHYIKNRLTENRHLDPNITSAINNPLYQAMSPDLQNEWDYIIEQIFTMSWMLIPAIGDSFFITNDNPFVCEHGLINPQSYFIFPISSKFVLYATRWTLTGRTQDIEENQKSVDNINDMIKKSASRFVFSAKKLE